MKTRCFSFSIVVCAEVVEPGRHARLRGVWGNPCGFKSRLRHQLDIHKISLLPQKYNPFLLASEYYGNNNEQSFLFENPQSQSDFIASHSAYLPQRACIDNVKPFVIMLFLLNYGAIINYLSSRYRISALFRRDHVQLVDRPDRDGWGGRIAGPVHA